MNENASMGRHKPVDCILGTLNRVDANPLATVVFIDHELGDPAHCFSPKSVPASGECVGSGHPVDEAERDGDIHPDAGTCVGS